MGTTCSSTSSPVMSRFVSLFFLDFRFLYGYLAIAFVVCGLCGLDFRVFCGLMFVDWMMLFLCLMLCV